VWAGEGRGESELAVSDWSMSAMTVSRVLAVGDCLESKKLQKIKIFILSLFINTLT
jgi:hypothetical protein